MYVISYIDSVHTRVQYLLFILSNPNQKLWISALPSIGYVKYAGNKSMKKSLLGNVNTTNDSPGSVDLELQAVSTGDVCMTARHISHKQVSSS